MGIVGIDIFSGAGGMSIGAEWAGVPTVLAIDSDPYASQTYAVNHPDAKVFQTDIRIFDFLAHRPQGDCVVFGGPPCQGFSTSNQRTRNADNETNWLFKEFLRAVSEIRPEWVVFENVKGITETDNASFLKKVVSGLEKLGYGVKSTVLNAKDFGVPQSRSRLFVVASPKIDGFEFPLPDNSAYVSARDALSDLPDLENGSTSEKVAYKSEATSEFARLMRKGSLHAVNNAVTRNSPKIIERYKFIPPGGNWSDIPAGLMQNYTDASRCHTGIYKRLKWDEVAVTIGNYRKNMLVHPEKHRGLSVREAARLQSFPDNFHFSGSIGFQQQQVGNAVPPLLAHAVFNSLISARKSEPNSKIAAE